MADPAFQEPAPRRQDPEFQDFLDKIGGYIGSEIASKLEAFGKEIRRQNRSDLARLEQRLSGNDSVNTVPLDDTGSPEESLMLNDRAVQAFYRGELEEAMQLLEQAVSVNAGLVEAWNNLGMVYSAMNRTEKALKAFEKALELAPEHTDLINNRAVLAMVRGNPGDALAMLEEARQNKAHDIAVLLNLAQAYQAVGRDAKAVATWKEVLAVDPAQPEAMRLLRRFYQ
ncbi:MAG: tetratricopeptide repeat protein [Acidobacteriota bacterium]|nr:tetratricopeptide repeat protein [Acidobacteriota bacterium]